jgi:hypothetical protein
VWWDDSLILEMIYSILNLVMMKVEAVESGIQMIVVKRSW